MKPLALATATLFCTPCFAQWSTDTLSEGRDWLAATTVGPYAIFAGGWAPSGHSATVDVYDSRTGAWSTSSLAGPSIEMSAASAGGLAFFEGRRSGNASIDIFDPAAGTWSTSPVANGFGSAAASTDTLVFFGGGGFHGGEEDQVVIHDTTTGTVSTDSLGQARLGLAATSVGDLVLFAGGSFTGAGNPRQDFVDVFDTTTGQRGTTFLSQPRADLAATSVGGKAFFAGGAAQFSSPSSRVDIYDAATGSWSQAELSQARWDLCAASTERYAFFAGGRMSFDVKSDRVDIYDSVTGIWSTASLSLARSRLTATAVGNQVLFAGGKVNNSASAVVDILTLGLGIAYCAPANPNSTGLPAVLSAEGTALVGANDLELFADKLPAGQFGYFLTSLTQGSIQPPASQGPICLAGDIGRYNRASEIIQGPAGSLRLDLASMPVNPAVPVLPGDTWNFQCWYRDANPGTTSNTTNGLAVTFATSGDPAVQFAVTQASVVEDATTLGVLITLSQASPQDVLVPYTRGGTATYNVDWRVEEPNPIVIPAGETAYEMTIIVAEDTAQEGDETAVVTLVTPAGGVLGTAPVLTLTIVDDD